MKVLILHAWLRGNLGDEILTSKVVERIKQIRGTYIHLISIHPDKSYRCPIKGLVDRFSTQSYKNHCDHEIEEADIVCIAPGGGLQKIGDERAPYIYRDAASALKKRKIVVFCGHSFCRELINKPILEKSVVISRERASHALLLEHGISSHLTADFAFLEELAAEPCSTTDTLLFLRFDNYKLFKLNGNATTLCLDNDRVSIPPGKVLLTSSDYERDKSLLIKLSKSLHWSIQPIFETRHLKSQILKSKCIITDRYHPAILANLARKDVRFLPQKIERDKGLQEYLKKPISELKILAKHGLDVIENTIKKKGSI